MFFLPTEENSLSVQPKTGAERLIECSDEAGQCTTLAGGHSRGGVTHVLDEGVPSRFEQDLEAGRGAVLGGLVDRQSPESLPPLGTPVCLSKIHLIRSASFLAEAASSVSENISCLQISSSKKASLLFESFPKNVLHQVLFRI